MNDYDVNDPWMVACRGLLSITMICAAVLNLVPSIKSLYVVVGHVVGHKSAERGDLEAVQEINLDDYEPTLKERVGYTTFLCLICAVTARYVTSIGIFISILGCLFGAPELILGES